MAENSCLGPCTRVNAISRPNIHCLFISRFKIWVACVAFCSMCCLASTDQTTIPWSYFQCLLKIQPPCQWLHDALLVTARSTCTSSKPGTSLLGSLLTAGNGCRLDWNWWTADNWTYFLHNHSIPWVLNWQVTNNFFKDSKAKATSTWYGLS